MNATPKLRWRSFFVIGLNLSSEWCSPTWKSLACSNMYFIVMASSPVQLFEVIREAVYFA